MCLVTLSLIVSSTNDQVMRTEGMNVCYAKIANKTTSKKPMKANGYDNVQNSSLNDAPSKNDSSPHSTLKEGDGMQPVHLTTHVPKLQSPLLTSQKPKKITPLSTSHVSDCLLYTSPSPRDGLLSRMPSSA